MPPSSPMTVGMTVPTIVPSSAATRVDETTATMPMICVRVMRYVLSPRSRRGAVMRGHVAIARILKCEGVEQLFCFPAHGLIDACAAEGIRPIIARTERTLAAMADGFTRVHDGRKIGVVAVQNGPGAE